MEAVKLESLQGHINPGITNLEIAQETLGSVVVVSCSSQQILVRKVTVLGHEFSS